MSSFHSPFLSGRVVPRTATVLEISRKPVYARSRTGESMIPWKEFAEHVISLPEDKMMTGDLPAGVSAHQFWAKAQRGAKALGGRMGISVRGGRFWVWRVQAAAKAEPVRENERLAARELRRALRTPKGWIGELMQSLESAHAAVKVERERERELTSEEIRLVRRAARVRGWRVEIWKCRDSWRVQVVGDRKKG